MDFLDLLGVPYHALGVFFLGTDFLFKSILALCVCLTLEKFSVILVKWDNFYELFQLINHVIVEMIVSPKKEGTQKARMDLNKKSVPRKKTPGA